MGRCAFARGREQTGPKGAALTGILEAIQAAAGSSVAQGAALYFIPFLHEDMAIVAAGLLIAQHQLRLGPAAFSLWAGMVSRDLILYGLGAAARRGGFARRFLIGPRVEHLGEWLKGNMTKVIVVSRLVPGLMFPAYVACGWFGLSFSRFAVTSMAMTAIYLPVILGLALLFGHAALTWVGGWAWLAIAAPLAVAGLLRARAAYRRHRRQAADASVPARNS
jgi:membrane protein DedA with SNARE-associated domain